MPDRTVEEEAARILAEDLKLMPQTVAEMRGQPYGVTPLTRSNEDWGWAYEDQSVDVPTMRAQGHTDADIAKLRFPLRPHLMKQAGLTYPEQEAYANRMSARYLSQQAAGQQPKPPERPPQQLNPGGM